MPATTDFQGRRGTSVITFTQNGTYSTIADMGGLRLVGAYSPAWPGGAGSLSFRAIPDGVGTGYALQTWDGTAVRAVGFGSNSFSQIPTVLGVQFVIAQIANAGTPGIPQGGTIILVGEA